MPIYQGNNKVRPIKAGSNNVAKVYAGYEKVFGGGPSRFRPPVVDGLLALYNPAYEGGYNGSNTIVDLWENGHDLVLSGTGYSQNTDNSIYISTGSFAITANDLSTDLHGTQSEFTVVFYGKRDHPAPEGIRGGGRWCIGPSGSFSGTNAVFEVWNRQTIYDSSLGIGTMTIFPAGGGDYFTAYNYPPGYDDFIKWKNSNTSINEWSFNAYSKADQTQTYTYPDSNLTISFRGNTSTDSGTWQDVFLQSSGSYNALGTPPSNGVWMTHASNPDTANVLDTNLASSRFMLNGIGFTGVADYDSQQFDFGGAAIYDRVLSATELQEVYAWFDSYY